MLRVVEGMAPNEAHALERNMIQTLAEARVKPVQGIEFYDSSVLGLIVDIVDHRPPPETTLR